MDNTTLTANPFPAEAVASYGTRLITCGSLQYMRLAQEELFAYLGAHSREDRRYGGAIALSGSQGSGKTHLLNWLGDFLKGTRSIRGTVLYAKCDSQSIFDLYRALMQGLERPLLVDLIQLALLALARGKVRSAAVTESLVERLETVGGMQTLQEEGNLDLEQLRHDLVALLDATSAGSNRLVRVLLDVPTSRHGIDAYQWLTGTVLHNPADLGVVDSLGGGGIGETNAIDALEMIASLHRVAGVPLLILVDQMEVLLPTEQSEAFSKLGSLVKKFVEQLSRQCALVFMAGMPRAWSSLPPDVGPRFRRPEPLAVGRMTVAECGLLLDAYTEDVQGLSRLRSEAVATLHQLSGGSPRDVLRIAHHAYTLKDGDLGGVDDETLLQGARDSGSLRTKVLQALTIVDSVLSSQGIAAAEMKIGSMVVDRLLLPDRGHLRLGLMVLQASDALDEVDAARRVRTAQESCSKLSPPVDLVFIAVGYSSPEVRRLIGASSAIVYDERTFRSDLVAALLSARASTEPVHAPSGAQLPLADSISRGLEMITERLDRLEATRREDAERVSERFANKSDLLADAATTEQQITTRRQVLDALDSLEEALSDEMPIDERKIIRSILVSNETFLKVPQLDEVGDLYLDVLARARMDRELADDLRRSRGDLISMMRTVLRRPQRFELTFNGTRTIIVSLLALVLGFIVSGAYSIARFDNVASPVRRSFFYLPEPSDLISFLPFAFGFAAFLVLYFWGFQWYWGRMRRSKFLREIDALRNQIGTVDHNVTKLHRDYPQARP